MDLPVTENFLQKCCGIEGRLDSNARDMMFEAISTVLRYEIGVYGLKGVTLEQYSEVAFDLLLNTCI